jgi:nucleotide-binding universal stress UspA family protein
MSFKILVPTDFSLQAEFALIMANKLADKMDVELELMHVIPCRTEARISKNGEVEVEDDSVQGFLQAKYKAALQGFGLYDTSKFKISEHFIDFGPLSECIINRASEGKFDLIIMGTKGAHGLMEKISGSETQHVVRQSRVPVLSLMCDRSELEIKDILLVHDFVHGKSKPPLWISKLAKAFDARLHLLQCTNDASKVSELSHHEHIEQFIASAGLEHIETHIHVDNDKERAVVNFNQMHDMDMIILGTEGRNSLQQLIHPSVAEKLVNHMYKPVITFHF